MRAALTILAGVTLAGSTIPAAATPFWQKPKTAQPAQHQAAPSNSLMAQPHGVSPAAVPQPHLNGPGPHNGDWLRKYGQLPQAEQEQKLESDPVFRGLAPEKQQSLLNRLRNFNRLSPSKRQQVLNRMEIYEHLTQDQQSQVSQAYKKLQKMSPEQRSQYFNSEEFQNMNEEQRNLLRGNPTN
jgi:hypothetical protein